MSRASNPTGNGVAKPNRWPIMLSALVLPGAGQLVQKRWIPGVFFSVSFLACFGALMVHGGRILVTYYRFAFDPDGAQMGDIPLVPMFASLGVAMLVYFVSLVDTYRGHVQACTRWASNRRRLPVAVARAVDPGSR